MQLKWLAAALRNLDEEAQFIAADDPQAASLVVSRLLSAVAVLAQQPGIGRPGRVPGTRELVVSKTRYLVPYRVRGDVVEVLRVFHTSRRPAMGLNDGDTVLWALQDGVAQLTTRAQRLRRAQALVRKYVKPGDSLVDDLIADRHAEAARE